MFLVGLGEPGGRRGIAALPGPGLSWALFLWAGLSQSAAAPCPRAGPEEGGGLCAAMDLSQSLLQASRGPCACPRTQARLWGTPPRPCSPSARPPVQQERRFLLWENLNERPICSQRESFCFGNVSSFRHGRVGTRRELKTPEKEEVRVKGGGKELG